MSRSDPPLTLAAVLCGALLTLPFWASRFVPLLDLPQHLAIAAVLRHHGDPAWGFDPFFEAQWGELTPYWLHYLGLELFALVMPLETASRVYLSLYAFAFPWAGMALCEAFGRPRRLGLLAAPLALNTNLYYGFVNYCSGIVLLLFALRALERHLARPSLGQGVVLGALTVSIFFAHVQVFVFLVLASLVLAAADERVAGPGQKIRLVLPVATPVALLFAPWAYLNFSARGGERPFGDPGDNAVRFEPFIRSLVLLPDSVAGAFQDGTDKLLVLGWALVLLALLLRSREERGASLLHRYRVHMLFGLALAGYFLLPFKVQGQWNINRRFGVLAALLAIPMVRAPGRPRRVVRLATFLTLASAVNTAWHHHAFDREVGPFEEALAAIPPRQRVMGLVYDARGLVMDKWPYLHFGQYYAVRKGGVVSNSFARAGPLPVRSLRREQLPHPSVWRPQDFRYQVQGRFYDYFLLREAPKPAPDVFGVGNAPVERIYEGGVWSVFRRVGVAEDP